MRKESSLCNDFSLLRLVEVRGRWRAFFADSVPVAVGLGDGTFATKDARGRSDLILHGRYTSRDAAGVHGCSTNCPRSLSVACQIVFPLLSGKVHWVLGV